MTNIADADRVEITDIINKVAYIIDAREYDRMGEVFFEGVQFSNPGRLSANGLDELKAAFKGLASPSISHHITNILLSDGGDGTVRSLCKALALRADKSIAVAEYTDVIKKTSMGWRIHSRAIRTL